MNRPYRHYSDFDLFQTAQNYEKLIDCSLSNAEISFYMKQLVLVEAEIAEREFED